MFLQVRPNADALYRSFLEPWSQWLSGPGVNPGYDPLAFAIQEAHRRGIELHAWFNPFRAKANVNHAVGRNHISLTRPDLMKRSGSVLLMNPSASASRDHAMKVILGRRAPLRHRRSASRRLLLPLPRAGQKLDPRQLRRRQVALPAAGLH